MPEDEQERRMRNLRRQVADNNIYRWAGMLLSEAGKLVTSRRSEASGPEERCLDAEAGQLVGVG